MESKRVRARRWMTFLLREGSGVALPGMAALLIFMAVGSVARSGAQAEQPSQAEGPARLCGTAHESRGESAMIDLEALGRRYAALKTQLTFTLRESRFEPEKALAKPYDLSLPACRGRSQRRVSLKEPLPSGYRTSKLYFMRLGSRGPTTLPDLVERDPATEILLVSAGSMRAVAELSRGLSRRVTLAPPKLLEVLGVRCANTMVTFTEKGDEALLAEGD